MFRLRPDVSASTRVGGVSGAHRELYNAALQERRDAWAHNKTRIFYGDQSAQLTEIRRAAGCRRVVVFEPASHATSPE